MNRKTLFGLLAMLFAVSCSGPELSFEAHSIMAFNYEDESSAVVQGLGEKTEILYQPEWADVSIKDSVLCVKMQPNTSDSELRDCILLANGKNKLCIPVIQGGEDPFVMVSDSVVVFDTCGGTQTVSVFTNSGALHIQMIDSSDEYIEADESFVDVKYDDGTLTLSSPPNKEGQKKGELVLIASDVSAVIDVLVKGEFCPTCNGEGTITCPKCKGEGWFFSTNNQGYYGCKNCGGSGYDQHYMGIHTCVRGSGKVPCPDCDGTGAPKSK